MSQNVNNLELDHLVVLYALGELDPDMAFTVEMELIKHPELMEKVRKIQLMDEAFSVALSQQSVMEDDLDEEDSEEETTTTTQEEPTASAGEPSPAETVGISKPETTIAASKPIYKSLWTINAVVLALFVLGGILLFPMFTKTTQVPENDPNVATNVTDKQLGKNKPTQRENLVSKHNPDNIIIAPGRDNSKPAKNLAFFESEILTKRQLPNVGDDTGKNLLESFSPENQKEVEGSVTKFINLLKDPQNAKAQDFKDISAELSKLSAAENNKELQAFISIVNKAAEIVQ